MSLPRAVRAVVFDMDGLLFDTERMYEEAFVSACSELGHAANHDVFCRLVGTPWATGRRLLLEHYGADFRVDELTTVWQGHFALLAEIGLPLKPGALELLALLDELGLPRAIATSSSHDTVAHHLAVHSLAARFHAVVAEGDYVQGKPAPDPFLLAARRLGVDPRDCLALEDSPHGVRAAAAAGMMTVMVPDIVMPDPELRDLCRVLPSLHEVRDLLPKGDRNKA